MSNKKNNINPYCVLAYIGILWIIGFLADKEDKDVRFHVNQGIILNIFSFAGYIILSVVSSILYAIAPVFVIITSLLWLVYYAINIFFIAVGIMNVKRGENKPLPVIGSIFSVLK